MPTRRDRRYPLLHVAFNSIVDKSILNDTEALGVGTNKYVYRYPLNISLLLSHADIFITFPYGKLSVYVEPYIGCRYNTTIDTVRHTT